MKYLVGLLMIIAVACNDGNYSALVDSDGDRSGIDTLDLIPSGLAVSPAKKLVYWMVKDSLEAQGFVFVNIDTIGDDRQSMIPHNVLLSYFAANILDSLDLSSYLDNDTIYQTISISNDSILISDGNGVSLAYYVKASSIIIAVDDIQDIQSITPALGSRIQVRTTGATYVVQSDSVAGYVTDGIAVINLGTNYAVLQSNDGWLVGEWLGVSTSNTDNKAGFVRLQNYGAKTHNNITFGTNGEYIFQFEKNYTGYANTLGAIEFNSNHSGMIFDMNGATILIEDNDVSADPNTVILIIPNAGQEQLDNFTIRNGRISGRRIDYPTQDFPQGILISAKNGENSRHITVENIRLDSLYSGITSYDVEDLYIHNIYGEHLQKHCFGGYARIGDIGIPVVVPDDFNGTLRTITIDGLWARDMLEGQLGLGIDLSAQDQAQGNSTYYFYKYRANVSNVHISNWYAGMKTAGYVELNANNITIDSTDDYGFWNNLEPAYINMSNIIMRHTSAEAFYFQTSKLNLSNVVIDDCSLLDSENEVFRVSIKGDSSDIANINIENVYIKDSIDCDNRVLISYQFQGKPVYLTMSNCVFEDLNSDDMAMWLTESDTSSVYTFNNLTFINAGQNTSARAIEIRTPEGTYMFNGLNILNTNGISYDGIRTATGSLKSKILINNYVFEGLNEEIDDDAAVSNAYISEWHSLDGSVPDFDNWGNSYSGDDSYTFDVETFNLGGNVLLKPIATPGTPLEGMIYANSTDHHLYFYNGTGWVQLDN